MSWFDPLNFLTHVFLFTETNILSALYCGKREHAPYRSLNQQMGLFHNKRRLDITPECPEMVEAL